MEHVRKPKLRFLAPVLESASLYKLVGLGLFIVVFSAVSGLWLLIGTRRSYADWGALVATLGTTSVIFVLSRLERLAGVDQAEHDPVLRRAKRLMIIGFALAVVLAGG